MFTKCSVNYLHNTKRCAVVLQYAELIEVMICVVAVTKLYRGISISGTVNKRLFMFYDP